jgi:RecB family exonuclease
VVAFAWPATGPAGDGGPLAPLVADALAALGIAAPAAAPTDPTLAAARSPREALRAAARGGAAAARALAPTPLGPRAADALARGRLEAARREAVRARRAAPHAGRLGRRARGPLAAALPAEWSPTQLEEYARCPFRLFLKVGAGLEEPGTDGLDIDNRDEGSVVHAALERFVRGRVERGAWPPAGSEADLAEARTAAEETFVRFERAGRTGDPAVWAARREAVRARLERVVQAEARDHDGLTPALLEHGFGGRSGRPPLELAAAGETVRLRGRIDRVDTGGDRLLVIDYKNGKAGPSGYAELLDPEAFGRTSFQIPAYLLAAARDLPGRPRLLATYALLRDAERLEPIELAADDPALAPATPAGAAPDARPFAASVVRLVRRIREGDFPIASRTCEHCPFGAVCRFEGAAAAGADEDAA